MQYPSGCVPRTPKHLYGAARRIPSNNSSSQAMARVISGFISLTKRGAKIPLMATLTGKAGGSAASNAFATKHLPHRLQFCTFHTIRCGHDVCWTQNGSSSRADSGFLSLNQDFTTALLKEINARFSSRSFRSDSKQNRSLSRPGAPSNSSYAALASSHRASTPAQPRNRRKVSPNAPAWSAASQSNDSAVSAK